MPGPFIVQVGEELAAVDVLQPLSKPWNDFQFVDLVIRGCRDGTFSERLNLSDFPGKCELYLASLISHGKDEETRVKLVVPSGAGWVMRCDFIPQRFNCCPLTAQVKSFLMPLQKVDSHAVTSINTAQDLQQVLAHTIAILQLNNDASFERLDQEVRNRISHPWLSPNEIAPRRLAWVQGREDYECLEQVLAAAAGLGIKLVVFDERGHWLQSDTSPWAHLREAFVEVDIAPDAGLPQRIVDAVRAYPHPIDGICAISDVRLAPVARACAMLGLPSEDPAAYDLAGDKGATRLMEPNGPKESFVLASDADLDAELARRHDQYGADIVFPLIVKPVVGWSSDCVAKVRNMTELRTAVRKASQRHLNSPRKSTAVVVEPYIDGPEVDVNFIMLDGEFLFVEVNDDFPSPGDAASASSKANFQETQNVLPSHLPKAEQELLKNHLRKTVLRQGFRSGVFHCEARVRYSTMRYGVGVEGVVDLQPKAADDSTAAERQPEVYLHEVNARPPGDLESAAVMLTYGVDYYGIRMLLALGTEQHERVRALSQSFEQGAQFHLSIMIIQQTRTGIMKTEDAAKAFLDAHPDVSAHVVDYYTRKKGGSILEGPEAASLWWLAFFSVTSRESRSDLLRRVAFVNDNFTYEMEEKVSQTEGNKVA